MQNNSTIDLHRLKQLLANRSLVFVGMMGCGKTAIGRVTANYFDLPFFDADEEIEKAAGMCVADFFEAYGEKEFRSGEQKVVHRLLEENQCVIGLGGGAFLSDETRKTIAEHAISIWLNVDLDTLVSRVLRKPGKRPLLSKGDPATILADLLAKRKDVYALADVKVTTSAHSKIKTRNYVIEALSSYLEGATNE